MASTDPSADHSAGRAAAPAAPWVIALAGMLALAVAMGIGRFAFTPLMPLMMRDGLIDAADGALLAAANYAGYLVGALSAARVGAHPLRLVHLALPLLAALTAAMAWLPGMAGWLAWRLAAGVGSAWVLVGTSSWALTELAQQGRASLAAWVYSGVGLGIAIAGLCTWVLAGATSATQWWVLAALALLLTTLVLGLTRRWPRQATSGAPSETGPAQGHAALIFCYAGLGFGYILPATYLPALARALIDDPRSFGLAWPAFGMAAAASTVLAARAFARWPRLRVWSACHAAMAVGNLAPLLSHSGAAIGASAVLVGGTFMVATMAGLQEARARSPAAPAALLGRMSAAFALGQILGPLVTWVLSKLPSGRLDGIELTLALASVLLGGTAAWLWRFKSPAPPAGAPGD